ncbi:MAG: hypothetical protein LBT89_01240 [Planctomycetaceae bacterium]|jgi:hypothetical protein|nr:hypothetical protein [Planctomycetaceae bacterium]
MSRTVSVNNALMFFLALIPLVTYFVFLIYLYRRTKPTVLRSSTAFALLAWGLFGLLSLGPGRLVIPVYLFVFSGYDAWLCWTLLYFAVAAVIAKRLDGIVVYHCRRETLLPALYKAAQELDAKAEWRGNVLSMYSYGLQWTVCGSTCLVFRLTQPQPANPNRNVLYQLLLTVTAPPSIGVANGETTTKPPA